MVGDEASDEGGKEGGKEIRDRNKMWRKEMFPSFLVLISLFLFFLYYLEYL